MAGIKVVVSESIERIYNENCQNLGILTTTDFGLIDRIRSGEPIPLSEFTAGADEITRQIVEYGGLFEFNMARLAGRATLPQPLAACASAGDAGPPTAVAPNGQPHESGRPPIPRPMTLGEKIFARKWVVDAAEGRIGTDWTEPGEAGFFRTDVRFSHEYVTPMAAIFFEQKLGADAKVLDPDSILFFRDHLTFLHKVMSQERIEQGLLAVANELEVKQREFADKQGIRLYGEQQGHVMGSEAICHSKILEDYAEPGMLIIGTDSHTPHAGAVGALAFGVGTTAIFNSWITKDVRARIPPSFRVVVDGTLPANCTAKDLMLEILRHPYVRDGHAIGQIVEYAGPVVERLSVDERATMTNMAAEVGAFTGLVAADERTVEFLVQERGMDPAKARALVEGVQSDPGAEYVRVIEVDASRLRPMVALPGIPGTGSTSTSWRSRSRSRSRTPGRARPARRRTWTCTPGSSARRGRRGGGACTGCGVLHPVRVDGCAGVRPRARLPGSVPRDRRRVHRAGVRGVHRGGAGDHALAGSGVGVVPEPELPGAVGAGTTVPGVALLGGRVGGGGEGCGVGGVGVGKRGRCDLQDGSEVLSSLPPCRKIH